MFWVLAIDALLTNIEDEVCISWGWGLELQYGIQILVYNCLLRCKRTCIESEVAIWFDVVNSRIVFMISSGTRPESVEKIEGLSGR